MAKFTNFFKKLGTGISGIADQIPAKDALLKGTKAAAIGSVIVAAGKGEVLPKNWTGVIGCLSDKGK